MRLTAKEVQELVESYADPLAALMVERGFDPKEGALLVMPARFRNITWGWGGPPYYVRFSEFVREGLLIEAPPKPWTPIRLE